MKKFLLTVLAISSLICFTEASYAQEVSPFANCALKDQPSPTNRPRTKWKPKAAHFNKAVMIVSQNFFPYEVDVRMYTPAGTFIEKARTKSSGIECARKHTPECLYAAVVIWKKLGSYYQNKYGEVWVRVKNARDFGRGCRYYKVPKASKAYNIKG